MDGDALAGQTGWDYGSEGWGFESLRARPPRSEPLSRCGRGSFANAIANSPALAGGRYGAGADVGVLGELSSNSQLCGSPGQGVPGESALSPVPLSPSARQRPHSSLRPLMYVTIPREFLSVSGRARPAHRG
jgi:hypothetical protein